MSEHWVLNENDEPVPADLMVWARFMESDRRVLKQDDIGEVKVSTVFLGLDHRFGRAGPPILYETMIFGGEDDQFQERYCTRDAALEGHASALAMVRRRMERDGDTADAMLKAREKTDSK
jgi:hypothetical protein